MIKRIVIEEVISQEFEIEVDANADSEDIYEIVRKKYKNSELVVDNPTLCCASVLLEEGDSWLEVS